MTVEAIFSWLQQLPFAIAISESSWMFPAIETLHVIALTLVIGSIAMLDLRLVGLTSRNYGVVELASEVLPWTWSCFLIAVLSGLLMFSSKAVDYWHNTPFRVKMVLIALAGLNMAFFHLTTYRSVHRWSAQLPPPALVRTAGATSLMLWTLVVFFGRWIGFV